MRPSSPPTAEIAATFFDNLFRSTDYYDLSPVGRYKLNQRLNITEETEFEKLTPYDMALIEKEDKKAFIEKRILTDNDILSAIKVLVQLKDSHGPADDIDHAFLHQIKLKY